VRVTALDSVTALNSVTALDPVTAPDPMKAVLRATPHRFPMLLIDRIDEMTPRRHGVALKAVSVNEFQAHGAPPGDRPPLPGTFIVDALGQLAIGVLSAGNTEDTEDRPRVWYLAAIEGVRFEMAASPGDLLRLEATVQRQWGSVSKLAVRATIEGKTVAEGVLLLSTGAAAGEPRLKRRGGEP
jgi:3-hydroxyacyl-[acyl-carrier-protein] dehydratase